MAMLLVGEADIRRSVSIEEAITVVEGGFSHLAAGDVSLPPVMSLEMPQRNGEVHVKGAYIEGSPSFAIKVATGFYDNPLIGLPSGTGMMLVFCAETGFPQALLLDNGYLTDVRTAAAGAVAAKYLARKRLTTVGVVGAGAQGRMQIIALTKVRAFQKLLVYDLDPNRAARYAAEMPDIIGVDCVAVGSAEEVVREADLVVTATPSTRPYVRAEWIHAGLHITAMGADAPHKRELYSQALAAANLLVCDLRAQCFERGELHHALEDGTIAANHQIIELGELTAGRHPGRANDSEVTICDLTGVGVQDAAIATLAYGKATEGGLGSRVSY